MENSLFADSSLGWEQRCAVIANAGYSGVYAVGYPLRDADLERLRNIAVVPRRYGLRVSGVYLNVDLALPPESDAMKQLMRLVAALEGARRLEVSFKHSAPGPADRPTEQGIMECLEAMLPYAARQGFDIALYPHSFYTLETTEQAEALVRRLAHPRLGFVFPTSHVYALQPVATVAAKLRSCAGRIASFNVCGCRRLGGEPPAKCAHFPIGEGDLAVSPLLHALADGGFQGDVIIQGHGWTGDLPAKLRQCRTAYERAVADRQRPTSCHIA